MNIILLILILFAITIFAPVIIILGIAYFSPQSLFTLRRNLYRHHYVWYARKYGYRAANRHVKPGPWVFDPWEAHILDVDPEPTPTQALARTWGYHLKRALTLPPYAPLNLSSRWQHFRLAIIGFLADFDLASVR